MRAGHRLVVHQQDLLRRAAAAAQQRGEDLRVGRAVGMCDADRLRLRVADQLFIALGDGLDGALAAAELGEADDLALRVAP